MAKVVKLKVKNVVGYPSVTPRIEALVKKHKGVLVLEPSRLATLDKALLLGDRLKVVIASLPGLVSSGIPVIGYTEARGIFRKRPLVIPPPEVMKIKVIEKELLPSSVLYSALTSPKKYSVLEKLSPRERPFALVRSMFSSHLPASPKDLEPDDLRETVNTLVKTKPRKEKT